MINISEKAISPDKVIAKAKRNSSGCVVTYVGLIREISFGKPVLSVEYIDAMSDAKTKLSEIADEARRKWSVDNIAISHRIGKLNVGDINLVVAVAAAHRSEGFDACQYIIDQFKQRLPTNKIETYNDHTTHTG
jgi:molybdopterin synthase catalytic subunit